MEMKVKDKDEPDFDHNHKQALKLLPFAPQEVQLLCSC